MRESALDLAKLASDKSPDAEKINATAKRINRSCTLCHNAFKNLRESVEQLANAIDDKDISRAREMSLDFGPAQVELKFVMRLFQRRIFGGLEPFNIEERVSSLADPETTLRATNLKFERRFAAIEHALAERGRTPRDATLAEMDALWDAAKASENKGVKGS